MDIIMAAVDLFLERGYEKTSMEAIAEKAGISKGGLYFHFNSKDEILIQANYILNEPTARMMQQALNKPKASEGLSFFIRNYLKYWKIHDKEAVFFFLSITKTLDSPELWNMYAGYMKKVIKFYQDLLQKGIDSGEFIPHSTYDHALILMSALDGITGYLVMNKNLDEKEIISIYEKKFIHDILQKNHKKLKGE